MSGEFEGPLAEHGSSSVHLVHVLKEHGKITLWIDELYRIT